MHLYACIRIHLRIYIYAYIHTYTHINIRIYRLLATRFVFCKSWRNAVQVKNQCNWKSVLAGLGRLLGGGTYVRLGKYTRRYAYIYIRIYTHIRIPTHIYAYIRIYTNISIYIYIYILYTHIHMHLYAYIYAALRIYIYAYIHTYTHIKWDGSGLVLGGFGHRLAWNWGLWAQLGRLGAPFLPQKTIWDRLLIDLNPKLTKLVNIYLPNSNLFGVKALIQIWNKKFQSQYVALSMSISLPPWMRRPPRSGLNYVIRRIP
jgi:hypothetical protein